MNDFIMQSTANFLGTVLGGWLLYLLLKKRIKKFENEKELKKLFTNLYGETITNYIIIERIIQNGPMAVDNDNFPIARLKTQSATNFLYTRPVSGNKLFYNRLRVVIANMEMANSLLDLIFSQHNADASRKNKITIIKTVPKTLDELNTILYDITVFNKEYKFIEGETEKEIEEIKKKKS